MTGIRGLAASNIAWKPADDDAVAGVLRANGFTGVEIAPSTRWESPIEASRREIASYRAEWEKRGLKIVAMQALLFGRPDLQLFGSPTVRRATREYLLAMIEMAAGLGAQALVFGAPKNRQRKAMYVADATEIAAEFFRDLGAVASSRGCLICIEPNPPSYGCDFITTTAEAVALCEAIASRGVRVQGDVGALIANGEDPDATLHDARGWLGHFHVSEPELAEISTRPEQLAAAAALRKSSYTGWVSIEMRAPDKGSRVEALDRAAGIVSRLYGPGTQ
jgi:D-psicose/D-tagatose/L-ribulose 3-epimerase